MKELCIVDLNKCPNCEQFLLLKNGHCEHCGAKIRKINKKAIKNENFLRRICKYDLNGKIEKIYQNVYECYPEDSKKEHKKRQRVIQVCDKKSRRFDGYQWRYVDDDSEINRVIKVGSSKSIVQVDFDGNTIAEFYSESQAKKKLNYTYTTISKACKKKRPPEDANFFLFFKDEFCDSLFQDSYEDYLRHKMKIEVYNPEKICIGVFTTYTEAANKLQVSATAVSNWCNGRYKPSGEYKDFVFKQMGISRYNKVREKSNYKKINIEIQEVEKENERLKEKIEKLSITNKEYESRILKLQKEIEKVKKRYPSRKYRVDTRMKFMMPVNEFINKFVKTNEIAGPSIYILTDENGKRYVGQSNRDDYSRIAEHFNGSSKDKVYEAYLNGVNFYIEQIITGWEEINIFNLNDAEAYFIALYNAFDNGYNATRGNHRYNNGKLDEILKKEK